LSPQTSGSGARGACRDQTLSFPIGQDVADFDPALHLHHGRRRPPAQRLFGLYKFDSKLREVPDLAIGQPQVSTNGLTYTFHLRTMAGSQTAIRSPQTTSSTAGTAPPPSRAITRACSTSWPGYDAVRPAGPAR